MVPRRVDFITEVSIMKIDVYLVRVKIIVIEEIIKPIKAIN